MTENSAGRIFVLKHGWAINFRHLRGLVAIACYIVIAISVTILELRQMNLETEDLHVEQTPVTLYRPASELPAPAVIVAHGFAGSRQMMDQIAISIARQGYVVASIDLLGHGRNAQRLSPDITDIDGTTAQLVQEVAEVADAITARPDTDGPVSFVGHSMATDVVIRASQLRDDVGAVIAISMYSPAVTASAPRNLLVVSGATEGHLRAAGLDTVKLLDPNALEGETVRQDGIARRTVVAPFVGHVGVLYSTTSLEEITQWIRDATGAGAPASLDQTGWVAGLLLAAVMTLAWPLSKLLPRTPNLATPPISRPTFLTCILMPIPVVLILSALPVFGISGYAAFGTLALTFGVWGFIQLMVLYRSGVRLGLPDLKGTLLFLSLSLIFAIALDRYGAAFLPTGDRLIILGGLLLGTLPAMAADTLIAHEAKLLRRLLARLALIITLAAVMLLSPTELGLSFTTLPVLVLYFLVYGSIARWVSSQRGPDSVALGKGIVLAWSIAASTPLFMAASMS